MNPKYEQLKEDIIFELGQLDIIVSKILELKREVNETNIPAIAVCLMNFYNGIENIMKRCSKEYYKNMPKSDDWHKKLLHQSSIDKKNKKALLSNETLDKLYNYLAFRHFFIHGYGFQLNWDKMKPLVDNIEDLWREIKNQLKDFMNNMGNL